MRIGVLIGLAENDPESKARIAGFWQAFERLGWFEGRNVLVDYRYAPAGIGAPARAKELIELHPDVVLTQGTPNRWADRIRVPRLLLLDERDLAGE